MGDVPTRRRSAIEPPKRIPTTSGIEGLARAPARGKYDRNRSPDERQKEQRRRLLDAAAHVLSEKGWADATVEAIVSRAGMSRRTFYQHFVDLRDCLLTLHDRITHAAVRSVEMQIGEIEDPAEMLRLGVEGFLGAIAAYPHNARVIFRVARAGGPEFEDLHDRMMARFAELASSGVRKAYELNMVKEPPDELKVFALCSAMEAVAMRFVVRGEEARALEAAPALIEMMRRVFA